MNGASTMSVTLPSLARELSKNVIEALAAVRRDLPGIGKTEQASAQQGGYSYRGIEAVTAAAGPLFGRHGVVWVPEVLEERVEQITLAGKPWTDTRMKIQYRVYGPGGLDDCLIVGPLVTIGRDNADKGANKCMTQAYKQALLQVLCIGDSKDDTDGTTHEADARLTPAPQVYAGADEAKAKELGWESLAQLIEAHEKFKHDTADLTDQERADAKAFKEAQGISWPMSREQHQALVEALARLGAKPFNEDGLSAIRRLSEQTREAAEQAGVALSLEDEGRPFE